MGREPDRRMDAYLVASARLGERKAWAALAVRWHPRLLVHAWRLLRDEEAAKDAVQEGWAEIVRSLRRLRDDEAFPAWAYRIVSRRCARYIGGARRRRSLAAALSAEATEPPAEYVSGLDHHRVRGALAALPPDQQAAVALFYLEELSVAEVAVALDVPAGTVKTRLMHARRKLRAAFEGEI